MTKQMWMVYDLTTDEDDIYHPRDLHRLVGPFDTRKQAQVYCDANQHFGIMLVEQLLKAVDDDEVWEAEDQGQGDVLGLYDELEQP